MSSLTQSHQVFLGRPLSSSFSFPRHTIFDPVIIKVTFNMSKQSQPILFDRSSNWLVPIPKSSASSFIQFNQTAQDLWNGTWALLHQQSTDRAQSRTGHLTFPSWCFFIPSNSYKILSVYLRKYRRDCFAQSVGTSRTWTAGTRKRKGDCWRWFWRFSIITTERAASILLQ